MRASAKQSIFLTCCCMDCFAAARNDVGTHLRLLAACFFLREVSFIPALSESRAQGMPGARCARGLVCNGSGRAHTSIQVTPESPGIPHAMVYGLSRARPGVPGLLATVIPEKLASQELDTSVGVPGPHVFSVRLKCRRPQHHPRPPHPAPRFVTLRNAPLSGRDEVNIEVICISEKQNIFSDGAGQGGQISAWGAR